MIRALMILMLLASFSDLIAEFLLCLSLLLKSKKSRAFFFCALAVGGIGIEALCSFISVLLLIVNKDASCFPDYYGNWKLAGRIVKSLCMWSLYIYLIVIEKDSVPSKGEV